MSLNEVTVLLVEDDAVDAMAVERAFQQKKIANPLVRAKDGVEALALLRDGGATVPKPRIVLLDLNLPRMNGLEFLEELRGDSDLSQTVVFVLTTSDEDADRTAAYERNVAGYIVKDRIGEDFLRLVELLDSYWKVVELP